MVEFLVYRILCGKLSFNEVPAALKEEVRTILMEEGHEELAK